MYREFFYMKFENSLLHAFLIGLRSIHKSLVKELAEFCCYMGRHHEIMICAVDFEVIYSGKIQC